MASLVEVVDGVQFGLDRKRCFIFDLNIFPGLGPGSADAETIGYVVDLVPCS